MLPAGWLMIEALVCFMYTSYKLCGSVRARCWKKCETEAAGFSDGELLSWLATVT
jgi:hypothetical protein